MCVTTSGGRLDSGARAAELDAPRAAAGSLVTWRSETAGGEGARGGGAPAMTLEDRGVRVCILYSMVYIMYYVA